MAYLGNSPARSFISFERQVFTIVNSQTVYTLDHSVTNENDIRLVVNNIVQEPGSGKAYTATGTTLTLSAALVNGTDEMYCVFLGRATATNAPGAGSVGTAQIADDAVTNDKISYPLAKSGATVSTLNRTTNDGSILEVQRQGTTVGSLETVGVSTSGRLIVKSTTFDGFLDRAGTTIAKWMLSSFTPGADNTFDLGRGTERWKDIYLSGGAYLGGTGSANKLDDYEEGTWTPTVNSGTVTTFGSTYTKIGRQVFLYFGLTNFSDTSSSIDIEVRGLPFTQSSAVGDYGGVAFGERTDVNKPIIILTSNFLRFVDGFGTTDYDDALEYTNINNGSDCDIIGTINYITDA
jgi:hypothetical protein